MDAANVIVNPDKAPHYLAAMEMKQASLVDPRALYSWSCLARDVGRLYPYVLKQGVVMEKTQTGDYQSYDMICKDVQQGRVLRPVDFYPHPVWDLETQCIFRVVHDWFHYETGLDFTVESELTICTTHHRYHFSPGAYPALCVEIYLQAAYGQVFGEFPPNKVFIPTMALKEHELVMNCHSEFWDFDNAEANKVVKWSVKL